jgi:hypothetical protein
MVGAIDRAARFWFRFSSGWVIEASGLVPVPVRSSLECVVEREVMSKETFRSEDVPLGIAMANLKF